MQDGRYAFRGKKHLLLPLLFLLPQLAITVVFFFYPAGEALMGSFYMEDSFGLSKEFVGLDNFITLFSDPSYAALDARVQPRHHRPHNGDRPAVRGPRRSGELGRHAVQIHAHHPLRRRAAARGRALAVPVQPFRGRAHRAAPSLRVYVEPQNQRQSGPFPADRFSLMETDLV